MFSYMHDHASSRMHAHIHTRTHVHIRTYIHALSRCLIRGKFFLCVLERGCFKGAFRHGCFRSSVTSVFPVLCFLLSLHVDIFIFNSYFFSFLVSIVYFFLFASLSLPQVLWLHYLCNSTFTSIKISIHKISIHVSTRSFSLSALPSFLAPPFRPCLCIFLPLPIPLPSLFSACPPSLRHPRVPRHKQRGRGNFRLLIGHHADLLPVRLQQQQRAFI